MLGWLRRRQAAPIPEALWQEALRRHPFLAHGREPHMQRLRLLAAEFLARKEFTGAQGFQITDEVALSIAVQAVLPLLWLGKDARTALRWYDDFVGIVVHPDEVVAARTVTDDAGLVHQYDEVLAGEAMDGGPVMLSWRDVDEAAAGAERGYNVVIHEFAHKIDLRDGAADGCPPLPSPQARDVWLAVLRAEYDAFRETVIIHERFGGPKPWLDPYGAEAIDEFFAVACEAYFVNRQRFGEEFAALVPLFDSFFTAGAPPLRHRG